MESRTRLHLLIGLAASWLASPASARALLTQDRALRLAFPAGGYERRTAFLSAEQAARAQAEARSKLESRVWTYYVGRSNDGAVTAYFESHPVRTERETLMVVVGADGKLRFVEVLAFSEPEDFMASPRWLRQFKDRGLGDELALRRGLANMTGATLTAESVTRAVRRVLAVHRVLNAAATTEAP